MNQSKLFMLWLIIIIAVFNQSFTTDIQDAKEVLQLTLSHPGLSKGEADTYSLMENGEGLVKEYSIDVKSVLCADKICKVVPVRMVWNSFGEYLRYELEDGVALEKAEGAFFTTEEYNKLHKILLDKASPFKDLTYYELTKVTHGNEDQEEVDGWSGATAVYLEDDASILGASWTCFTLWHWANGDATQKIRIYAASQLTLQEMVNHLLSKENKGQKFVLEELNKRQVYNQPLLDTLTQCAKDFNNELTRLALDYIEKASKEVYTKNIHKWYATVSAKQRVLILNSIIKFPKQTATFYNSLQADLTTYPEVDLFFTLMEEKNENAEQFTAYALQQLLHQNILISRRAYWFLNSLSLNDEAKAKVQQFKREHAQSL